jgi:hypothetical protein
MSASAMELQKVFFDPELLTKLPGQDRWLNGQRVADLEPWLFAAIPKRRVNKRTVKEALFEHTWISDITGAHCWCSCGVFATMEHTW